MKHPTPMEIKAQLLSKEKSATRAHIASCQECTEAARVIEALGDPLAWDAFLVPDAAQLDEELNRSERILQRIEDAERLRHADPTAAVALCDELLGRSECEPVTQGGRHLSVLVLRERANALRVLGELQAAIETIRRARVLAASLIVSEYEDAILDYIEATVLFEREDLSDVEALAKRAETTFVRFGDTERADKTRLLWAAVSYKRGNYDAARLQFLGLLQSPGNGLDSALTAGLLHNLADCEVRLGLVGEARAHITAAAALYRELGMTLELTRLSWFEARIALAAGDIEDAERLYRETESGFAAAGLSLDAALVGLELVELFEREGRRDELVALATHLASVFNAAGTRMSLATAFASLRDAAVRGEALAVPAAAARTTLESFMNAG